MSEQALIEHASRAVAAGHARVSRRGAICFGTSDVRMNFTEADECLVVREVLVGYHRPNKADALFVMTSRRVDGTRGIARFKSRASMQKAVRSACKGWPAHGTKYVEVLPWREDGKYPPARGELS